MHTSSGRWLLGLLLGFALRLLRGLVALQRSVAPHAMGAVAVAR